MVCYLLLLVSVALDVHTLSKEKHEVTCDLVTIVGVSAARLMKGIWFLVCGLFHCRAALLPVETAAPIAPQGSQSNLEDPTSLSILHCGILKEAPAHHPLPAVLYSIAVWLTCHAKLLSSRAGLAPLSLGHSRWLCMRCYCQASLELQAVPPSCKLCHWSPDDWTMGHPSSIACARYCHIQDYRGLLHKSPASNCTWPHA